jgi:hypothetical protein
MGDGQLTVFGRYRAAAGLALVADDMVAVLLGPKWLPVVTVLRLLCIYPAVRSCRILAAAGPVRSPPTKVSVLVLYCAVAPGAGRHSSRRGVGWRRRCGGVLYSGVLRADGDHDQESLGRVEGKFFGAVVGDMADLGRYRDDGRACTPAARVCLGGGTRTPARRAGPLVCERGGELWHRAARGRDPSNPRGHRGRRLDSRPLSHGPHIANDGLRPLQTKLDYGSQATRHYASSGAQLKPVVDLRFDRGGHFNRCFVALYTREC